jgi:hypothetical protein
VHHRRSVDVAQRRKLDESVAPGTVEAPAVAAHEHFGASDAHQHDRGPQRIDQGSEQIERVEVRPLQIVEDEDGRIAGLARVGLEKIPNDRSAHRANLL